MDAMRREAVSAGPLTMGKHLAKKRAGRPRLAGNGRGKSPPITMRISPELLARLDKWRKAQTGKPGRSEALRQLADSGLSAAGF